MVGKSSENATPAELIVFRYIEGLQGDKASCYPRYKTMGQAVGLSGATCKKIAEGMAGRFIEIADGTRPHRYFFRITNSPANVSDIRPSRPHDYKTTDYGERLRDQRWLDKRREILQKRGCACEWCGIKVGPFNIHHGYYLKGRAPWEYDNETLHVLCQECHEEIGKQIATFKQHLAGMGMNELFLVMHFVENCDYCDFPEWSRVIALKKEAERSFVAARRVQNWRARDNWDYRPSRAAAGL